MKKLLLFAFFLFVLAVPIRAQVPLTVTEVDGSPKKTFPTKLVFQNGTVTVSGGVVTVNPAGGGGGDVSSNTATSVDSEIVLFSGTGGKTIKRASTTGILLGTSGVISGLTTSAGIFGAISDETGTGVLVGSASPTFTGTPVLSTATVTSINGLTITTTTGTLTITNGKTLSLSNTLTFTGTDSSSVAFGAGGTVLYSGGALGTPSSGTLTNVTGLPISTGVSGLGTGVATFLGTPSSANLISAVTDESGTGALVFANTPTLVAPVLGAATGTSINLTGAATVATALNSCADAGANDTYTCSLSPAPAGYSTGQIFWFKANTANTGVATVNFNSLGAKTVKKVAGGITTDLADNDIRAGQWIEVMYDGTNMQMLSMLGNAAAGSGTVTSIATTSPITGGTIISTGTIACATCVTSGASLTSTAIVTGAGSQGSQTPSTTTTLDSSGNISTPGTLSTGAGGSAAGVLTLTEGTAPTAAAINTIQIQAPVDVTTAYDLILPAASTTGFLLNTNASNVGTLSIVGSTGTGNVVRTSTPGITSPDITTSITTPSTTFSLVNSTATTVNFAGAATTLNIGTSATVLNFGGGATAAEIRFLEPSGSGSNYTSFKAVAQAANAVYTLPPDDGTASQFLQTDGAGVLTWATPAGSGTVTATGGSLTANAVVLGAGTTDTKVVAGVTTNGTAQLVLGVNTTTLGSLKLFGNTSGDVTLQPNAVAGTAITLTLPATTGTVALTSQLPVQYINAIESGALPDSSGNVFEEPYPVKATNDFWKHGHFIFNDTATDDSLYGKFELNRGCTSGATITMVWTTTATTGNIRYTFSYRVITADDTNSLDQATSVEDVTITDTAPGAVNRRMSVTFTPTNSNFATAGTVEWKLTRTGSNGGDTMAAAAQLVGLIFSCTP